MVPHARHFKSGPFSSTKLSAPNYPQGEGVFCVNRDETSKAPNISGGSLRRLGRRKSPKLGLIIKGPNVFQPSLWLLGCKLPQRDETSLKDSLADILELCSFVIKCYRFAPFSLHQTELGLEIQ